MIKRFSLIRAAGAGFAALGIAICAANAPENDWKLSGPFGGTATTVALDPNNSNIVLAGAMNSLLFQSQDAGASWNLLHLPKRTLSEVTSILVDPADSNHYLAGMIAAEGGGLFESRDRGVTWQSVNDIRDFGVRALAASASKPSRFIAGTLRGVMLSDDSGKTWTRISDPENQEMQGITAVALDVRDPNIIYAGTTHLPWKTMDGGKTWSSIHTGMIDDSDVFSIYINPAMPTDILASACSGIYSSSDRGDLWHKLMGIPNTSRRTHVIRQDPTSADIIYAGTTTGLFKSVNRGTTWKTLTNTQVNALAFDLSHPQRMYLALEYEGVGKSENGGEQINPINQGFVDRSISSVAVSGNKLVALETQEGETSGIFVSTDRGASWSQLRNTRGLSGVHLRTIAGMTSEERILLAASPHQMYKSIDAGLTWKALPVRLVVPPPAEPAKPATAPKPSRPASHAKTATRARTARPVKPKPLIREISPSDVSGLYTVKNGTKDIVFAATDLGLLKSEDMGEHWTLCEIAGSTAVTALYSAPDFSGTLVARASGGLYLSKDSGEHWALLPFPLASSDVNDVAIPVDQNAPLLVATRVGLYSSPDAGSKWFTNSGGGLPASTVASVLYTGSESSAYAVEYGRLYQSNDGGNSWAQISTAFPALRIRRLWKPDRNFNRLYAITGDVGIIFRD